MPRARSFALWAGLLAAAVSGCSAAGSYAVSVGDKTTLMYGWETRFGIDWTVEPETPQTQVVRGFVFPRSPNGADQMRLLVQAADASGNAVAQRLVWLTTGVPGAGGTYFEARGMPWAEQYRVTVWDYTRIESPSILR
jgi:hypothetical protein